MVLGSLWCFPIVAHALQRSGAHRTVAAPTPGGRRQRRDQVLATRAARAVSTSAGRAIAAATWSGVSAQA